jgi:methylmalonyl-CoA mutase cobalamin-binding subunit
MHTGQETVTSGWTDTATGVKLKMSEKMQKRILLAPLDPVHDIGLKMIRLALEQAGHITQLLPPDYQAQEIIQIASEHHYDFVMVSRTLGYGIAELLGQFIDMADAAGIRDQTGLIIGGMAIRPELAAELGFDAGFGPGTDPLEVVAYVEGKPYILDGKLQSKEKTDLTSSSSYQYHNGKVLTLLDEIVDGIIAWGKGKSSPGVVRGRLRQAMLRDGRKASFSGNTKENPYLSDYLRYADATVRNFYAGAALPKKTRFLSSTEQAQFRRLLEKIRLNEKPVVLQHHPKQPKVFIQYGTGCPFMDATHIKISEAWGADGVLHFDPSWGARTEGLLDGSIAHEEDGSVITYDNLAQIKRALNDTTLWTVRAHRGLNTPETVVLAGETGADLTKINIVYGSLGAGTDPERLTVDGMEAIRLAAEYALPFDIPTNEELCGVPAYKAFAGMLIVAHLGIRLGAKPLLKPLFCYSPEVMINGQMKDNYIDYNAAKILALQSICDIPVWPGEPIGFLTHSEDRVQSSLTTALHASLAATLRVPAISIASSDEAYSGGPITAASRIDTLRSVRDSFRFFGGAGILPTPQAEEWSREIEANIIRTLERVIAEDSFISALYNGVLGSQQDGAYPGRTGRGTTFRELE